MATIFALASGRPPAAIAIVRISGPSAHAAAERLAAPLPAARVAVVREIWHPDTSELLDQALVLRFDTPASATGEDVVELHCHGGRAVVDAVLNALGSLPETRPAQPGEFTRRAFENGRIDLTAAEGLADLLEAETESQRKAALALAEGGLRRRVDEWQEQVLALSALVERAIDYDDEDVEAADPALSSNCASLALELEQWCARPRAERLKDGLKVVIAGPPNVGKSSLLNALLQQDRAIVRDTPGTTRDHIEVPLALAGIPLVLTDTAGVRDTDDPIEAAGVDRATRLSAGSDILIWMGAVGDVPRHSRAILVHGKADLDSLPAPGTLPVSSTTGEGIEPLLTAIVQMSRTLLPAQDSIALNSRQATHIGEAAAALASASRQRDIVLVAEDLRAARQAFDRLTGRAGMEDVLDALFGRFCLGK